MKKKGFTFFPRRIFVRPWKRDISAPFLIAGSIGALAGSFYLGSLMGRSLGMVNGLLAGTFLALAIFLVCAALSPDEGEISAKIGWRKISFRELLFCCGALLVMVAGSSVITFLWQQFLEAFQIPYQKEQGLLQLARQADKVTFFKIFILTAVGVPFVEELVFRRALYALLLKLGPPAAMIGTALIFAAAHGFLLGLPGLFFMGVIFQMTANMTRNLLCSVLLHAMLNGSVLLMALISEK